jgi:hypothetical protein
MNVLGDHERMNLKRPQGGCARLVAFELRTAATTRALALRTVTLPPQSG